MTEPIVRRVLMTVDPGEWPRVVALARLLAHDGVQVVLAALGGALDPSQRAQVRHTSGITLVESSWRLEWADNPWYDVMCAGQWLLELAHRTRPDVVHLTHLAYAALPWPAPVLVDARSCVLSWWEAVHGRPAPAAWDRYWYEVARSLRQADLVVGPTKWMVDNLARHYGPLGATEVVPWFGHAPLCVVDRDETFVLAETGLWDEARGIATLERVAARLPIPIAVAGSASSGCPTPLTRLGPLSSDELAAHRARASVFLQVGRYEPFGWGALQAGLSGCALVLSDLPSLREVWGDAACFVDPDDEDGFVEILDALATVDGLRHEMSERARRRAATFGASRATQEWRRVYASVVESRGRRGPVQEVPIARGDVLPLAAFGLESP